MMKETLNPDRVKEDPELSTEEKETQICFGNSDDKATVFTESNGLMRRLIQHPLFEVTMINEKGDNITGVKGKIPIGCLSIGSTERKTGSNASVVTNGVTQLDEDAVVNI